MNHAILGAAEILAKVNSIQTSCLWSRLSSGCLLRDEREFAEVVILERALGIGRLIQIKCPRDMDFKRAGFDKAVDFLERRRRVLAVVALDFDSGTFFGGGLDAVGV